MTMKKLVVASAAIGAALFATACSQASQNATAPEAAPTSPAEQTAMAGATQMDAARNIVENASSSPDHTTLVTAVQAAGLVETLSGTGPFTVFAPTNAAFAKLPAGTVETLTQPANRATLTGILTYHVVPGRVTSTDLVSQIQAGGGRATLTTVQGATLTATLSGNSVIITDAAGGTSTVTGADLMQSNGVIHVVDTVLMPPQG